MDERTEPVHYFIPGPPPTGNPSPFDPRRWWGAGAWQKVVIISSALMLVCCCGFTAFALSPAGQQLARETEATETVQTQLGILHGRETATIVAGFTPTPTRIPTQTALPATATIPANATPLVAATATMPPTAVSIPRVTATPRPQPTNTPKPLPPTATPIPTCGAPANPWGYGFCGGSTITAPPGDFCSYFACIGNFWNGTGYVVECQDTDYSKSGGLRGACSSHGGEWRALLAP